MNNLSAIYLSNQSDLVTENRDYENDIMEWNIWNVWFLKSHAI